MSDYTIVAASPYFGGTGTVPHRVVILRWESGRRYSVHTQEEDGSISDGDYTKEATTAVGLWLSRTRAKYDSEERVILTLPEASQ